MTTLETKMMKRMTDQIAASEAELDKFREKMEVNPVQAFEWADEAFTATASLEAATLVRNLLEKGKGLDDIDRIVSERVAFMATNVERSTSLSSNHLNREKLAAYGELSCTIMEWLS